MDHPSYAAGSSYPLTNIEEPHPNDVLCGRGGAANSHIGNTHWRMLVAANKELYASLPKHQKQLLSRSIVNAVRSQHPSGRFLQKDNDTELWFDVGDQRAVEKTSQALREGSLQKNAKNTDSMDQELMSLQEGVRASEIEPFPVIQVPPKPTKSDLKSNAIPDATTNGTSIPPPPQVDGYEFSIGSVMSEDNAQLLAQIQEHAQPPPPTSDFSLGSIQMNDTEHARLVNDSIPPPQVDRGFEPAGFSVGSMMSLGTVKLEDAGFSMGSAMSFMKDVPESVEGGLDAIGTSFGSMSISTMKPVPEQQPPAMQRVIETEVEGVPTFLAQQKSKGSLLECSDTDSDTENNRGALKAQKSQNWLKFKAAFEDSQASSGEGEASLMPPPVGRGLGDPVTSITQAQLTDLERDVSGLSMMDDFVNDFVNDGDGQIDAPALREQESEEFEKALLSRGDSLAAEEFILPVPK